MGSAHRGNLRPSAGALRLLVTDGRTSRRRRERYRARGACSPTTRACERASRARAGRLTQARPSYPRRCALSSRRHARHQQRQTHAGPLRRTTLAAHTSDWLAGGGGAPTTDQSAVSAYAAPRQRGDDSDTSTARRPTRPRRDWPAPARKALSGSQAFPSPRCRGGHRAALKSR